MDAKYFPGGPVVKTALPLQGAQVRSPVREDPTCGVVRPKKKRKKRMPNLVSFWQYLMFTLG